MKHLSISSLTSVAAAFVLMTAFSARAVPGDEHWDVQFGWPGSGLNSDSIVAHNGKLYVSGAGSSLTNVPLEVWDGSQWSAQAQFIGPSSTIVYDLAFLGETLFAAGTFTNVNGVAAGGLAQWDGTTWSSVNGFNGTVTGLTVDGANLYVSGIFTNAVGGGVVATNIAYWDGSAWHALGNGLGVVSGTGFGVHATAIKNGLVYAVGLFTNSGPQSVTNVAVWDGSTWSAVGGGVNNVATSVAFYGSDLYVGGAFSKAGSTNVSLLARWDGANWYGVGLGLTGLEVLSLTTYGNSVYVAGIFTTASGTHATNVVQWDGTSLNPLGSGISSGSTVTRVYNNGTNVVVGGAFFLAGGVIANEIATWDGFGNWGIIGTPGRINGASSVVRAFAGTPTNLYVGGAFNQVGQTNARLVAQFDGANWSPMGSGVSGGSGSFAAVVNAMDTTSSNVYVGGLFNTAGSVSAADIAAWDGANWSALGSGPGGVVAAITVRTDGVYAAGAPQGASLYGSPFFLRWDGASWQSVLVYNPNDTFLALYINDSNIGMDAMAFQDTNIYVGGHFSITWHDPTLTFETNCMNIMRFDGTYARIVGTGLNSNVVAMTMLGTNLYVAGLFTNAGGLPANHIAMWDGNVWSAVGSGVVGNGTVNTLTTIGTNLYAGGTFTNMGGVRASRIAKWDGNVWSALGSGVSATVQGLYSSGSNLYAGGSLRAAGGYPSQFLGLWNDQASFRTPQLSNSAWLGNGQFRARVYSVAGTTNVVEATTDFSSWTPVATNSIGNFDVTDTGAGASAWKFYRARLVP
jgi:hypothetical protein